MQISLLFYILMSTFNYFTCETLYLCDLKIKLVWKVKTASDSDFVVIRAQKNLCTVVLLIENYKRNITGRTFLFALTELVFRVTRTHIYDVQTYNIYIYIYSCKILGEGRTDERSGFRTKGICTRPRGTRMLYSCGVSGRDL